MMHALNHIPYIDQSAYSRPATDLQVHTFHDEDENWHRRAVDGTTTACGRKLPPHSGLALRWESYDGPLCPDCFTKFERELAAKHRIETSPILGSRRRAKVSARAEGPATAAAIPTGVGIPPDEARAADEQLERDRLHPNRKPKGRK